MDLEQTCSACQEPALYSCSKCGNEFYCSEDCQRRDWPNHRPVCGAQTTPASRQNSQEDDDNISFYVDQLTVILKPVTLCILLSVLWVKLANPSSLYYQGLNDIGPSRPTPKTAFTGSGSSNSDDVSSDDSLIIAASIAGSIVLATIVIAALVKYRQEKILGGFILLNVSGILGYFGYTLGTTLISIYNIRLDWITFSFVLFNFVSLGVAAIFWKGPLLLQQFYLVVLSSMMAFSLTSLPALVTWILLSFLAVWDLIAVLCPYGPLRVMLESAQANNIELPSALIYTSAVTFMANFDNSNELPPPDTFPGQPSVYSNAMSSQDQLVGEPIELQDMNNRQEEEENIQDQSNPEEQSKSGLKLGLGDFVFYSVLVARVSLNEDWITTVGCILAVLSGLVMTIFILVWKKRPLPALPISILFGILVYFLGTIALTPMIESLITGSLIQPQGPLWAGSQGVGFVYI